MPITAYFHQLLSQDCHKRGDKFSMTSKASVRKTYPLVKRRTDRGHYLRPIAHLKPGVRPERALAQVSAVFAQLTMARQNHSGESGGSEGRKNRQVTAQFDKLSHFVLL
jgi:hypothetical protein